MNTRTSTDDPAATAGFAELFTPKLVTVLREGYGVSQFRSDLAAGLTVAIVALPLSMAIAIASGASPAQGLYAAIIGGFLVSALGGSRFQIGGPAGAFIVLVAATVQLHGMDGLILATILSGALLLAIGLLRLGTYIKFIPYPVTVGFTAGIAVIIFASQIKELLGLSLAGREPGPLVEKLPVIWAGLPTFDPPTVALALATIGVIVGVKRLRPHWPGMLIAVAGAAAAAAMLDLPVATIGTRFGGIPDSLPMPALPEFSIAKIQAVFPSAVAFALLGSIESLLSAVVADGMTGRRHRSNCELVAQGAANLASGIFGGICVTGTIARTATNVRAGAHGPIAGILHSAFLLLFILVAAPLASYIPLASLAGVLAVVAWNMVEKHAFLTLLKASRGDAAVLSATFLLTIFRDLTEAIVVGFALGSVLFIHRMSKTTAIAQHAPLVIEDRPDDRNGDRAPYDEASSTDPDVVVYRISGAFFFGAAASISSVLDRIDDTYRTLIIDFAAVPFLDSTAANTLESLARKAVRRGARVTLTGTSHGLRKELFVHGIKPPLVHYEPTVEKALKRARNGRAGVVVPALGQSQNS
ncbi:SulP family inorganic anion transporter [Thalassobaculum sp.]|uniref:SulP family inorganic anion transporter n=1 Tax=Thalassobaculum sp. TaxID=2022740 RepID=UPI0032EDB4FA